jgi:hypothetical protein
MRGAHDGCSIAATTPQGWCRLARPRSPAQTPVLQRRHRMLLFGSRPCLPLLQLLLLGGGRCCYGSGAQQQQQQQQQQQVGTAAPAAPARTPTRAVVSSSSSSRRKAQHDICSTWFTVYSGVSCVGTNIARSLATRDESGCCHYVEETRSIRPFPNWTSWSFADGVCTIMSGVPAPRKSATGAICGVNIDRGAECRNKTARVLENTACVGSHTTSRLPDPRHGYTSAAYCCLSCAGDPHFCSAWTFNGSTCYFTNHHHVELVPTKGSTCGLLKYIPTFPAWMDAHQFRPAARETRYLLQHTKLSPARLSPHVCTYPQRDAFGQGCRDIPPSAEWQVAPAVMSHYPPLNGTEVPAGQNVTCGICFSHHSFRRSPPPHLADQAGLSSPGPPYASWAVFCEQEASPPPSQHLRLQTVHYADAGCLIRGCSRRSAWSPAWRAHTATTTAAAAGRGRNPVRASTTVRGRAGPWRAT